MDLRSDPGRAVRSPEAPNVSSQALEPSGPRSLAHKARAFYALTKPRVVSLIVFTAVIGMFLSTPGMVPLQVLLAGTVGIALVAGAAAAVNCLVEQKIDALMRRTSWRPLPRGDLTPLQTLVFAGAVGGVGLWMLNAFVNPLTMWLTLGTFVGYAIVYTVILKPATPQNIVIGGASGAMPPVLGWAAVTGEVTTEAMMLFLIIYTWTPPHFWALALYRTEEYAKAGLPMLPVTHGQEFTRLHVLLYTIILFAASLLPFVIRMNGWLYLAAALVLGGIFLVYAVRIYISYSDRLAQQTFRYSILYLSLLFAALLADHYLVA
jgi:protoheme IX farnesyltransferase